MLSMKQTLANRLLDRLPAEEFERLAPALRPVSLSLSQPLSGPGESARFVYFPEDAIVSLHSEMENGRTAEVAMVGRDGAAGLPSVLGIQPESHWLCVTVAGSALRMEIEVFRHELDRSTALRHALLDYAGEYVAQLAQRSACGVLHKTEQRLAVWLLMITDRLVGYELKLTHERIARHLGVRRAGVTEIANQLEARGVINHSRGRLRVTDRPALEAAACECYRALGAERRRPAYMQIIPSHLPPPKYGNAA